MVLLQLNPIYNVVFRGPFSVVLRGETLEVSLADGAAFVRAVIPHPTALRRAQFYRGCDVDQAHGCRLWLQLHVVALHYVFQLVQESLFLVFD